MHTQMAHPMIDRDRCTGCGDCVLVCHTNALAVQETKAVIVDAADCDFCTECEVVCPVQSILCLFEVVLDG